MIRRIALAVLLAAVLSPAAALAQSGPTKLSPTAPPWLTDTTPVETTTVAPATTTAAPVTTTTPAPTTTTAAQGDLPFTGDDLLPEAIVALILIGAGVLIRIRW